MAGCRPQRSLGAEEGAFAVLPGCNFCLLPGPQGLIMSPRVSCLPGGSWRTQTLLLPPLAAVAPSVPDDPSPGPPSLDWGSGQAEGWVCPEEECQILAPRQKRTHAPFTTGRECPSTCSASCKDSLFQPMGGNSGPLGAGERLGSFSLPMSLRLAQQFQHRSC